MKTRFYVIALCLCFITGAAISASAFNASLPVPAVPIQRAASSVRQTMPKVVVHEAGLPERLRIRKLNIDAVIEHVGLTEDGAMDVPSDWWTTAWYDKGARPGEKGNAVIAGHYDADVGPAIFVYLERLKPGDEIEVTDDRGDTRTFTVDKTEAFEDADAPMERIFGDSSGIHLNLVTCDGTWDPDTRHYSKRFVVFTTLKEE